MRRASITEAKNQLSALIRSVESGEESDRLARLVHEGVVRPRRAMPPLGMFTEAPPSADAGASVLDALIEERRRSR